MSRMQANTQRERGAGLLSSVLGLTVFLVLLLFCVQVMYHLYATSAVTGALYDAGREVAGYDAGEDRAAAAARAEAKMRDRLGQYGRERVELRWDLSDPNTVRVEVRADHPSVFPSWFSTRLPFTSIERSVDVAQEVVQ